MLAASGKGTVPVLVLHDGQVIDESLDVMRWALGNSDPEGWLTRDDAALIEANDGAFKQNLDGYKYPDRHALDPLECRDKGLTFLRGIEVRVALRGGQIGGSMRGLVDAAIFPFVRQFAGVDPEWFDAQPLPHLQKWLRGHLASALFEAIMMRVAPWSPGDPPVILPQHRTGCLGPPLLDTHVG
jgi:glutathione S-transferase